MKAPPPLPKLIRCSPTGPAAFGLPPFGAIRPEHFRPAFDRALAAHRAEIDAIAADPAEPSFANTIEALERAAAALDRVSNVFFVLAGADTGDALEAVERDISPLLARHSNAMYLDRALYARIADLYAAPRLARPVGRAGPGARPLPHPLRAGRRRARTSRRRTGSPPSTSGWRASAPSSARTCWPTRRPMR